MRQTVPLTREELTKIIRTEINRATREIIKALNTRNIEGLDIAGPRTAECKAQVMEVVRWLANPRHPQSIHDASHTSAAVMAMRNNFTAGATATEAGSWHGLKPIASTI